MGGVRLAKLRSEYDGGWSGGAAEESSLSEEMLVVQSKVDVGGGTNGICAQGAELRLSTGTELKRSAGSVDDRLSPRFGGCDDMWLSFGSVDSLPEVKFPSLRLLITARLLIDKVEEGETFLPTQSLQFKASPKARSHLPISLGERPDNLAHARLE